MMTNEHFVVLGTARPRSAWLADVGRWSNTSMVPIEFIRCVSVDEVRSRLRSDRRFSAVLLGEDCSGLDRDIIESAREARCVPIVITDGTPRRDWVSLGVACTLSQPLTPEDLLSALADHAFGVDRQVPSPLTQAPSDAQSVGRLIAVLGAGGTGTSTTAMAIATHFASPSQTQFRLGFERVSLLDASLNADQALLHDLGDVVPGFQELVDLHRTTSPSPDDVRSLFWFSPRHGYDVLPGLRRHREWCTLRRRTTLAALASARHAYDLVVADTDSDFEGEEQTGSIDIEDRNLLARQLATTADLVVVTSRAGISGVHRALQTLRDLLELGVESNRLLLVTIGAPRSTRQRSELTRTILHLMDEAVPSHSLPTPVMVPIRREIESFLNDGTAPPRSAMGSITTAVAELLSNLDPPQVHLNAHAVPIAIVPGHLGRTA